MRKGTLFFLITLGLYSFQSQAQWVESGNLKNVTWEYSFTGSGTVNNPNEGIEKASTPTKENFLAKPSSGEVKVIGTEEKGKGRASFTLNNNALTMVHTSGRGFQAAPAKFVAKDFAAKSKVMSAHFNLTPNSTAENFQAVWYIIVGEGGNVNVSGVNAPAISKYLKTDNGVYTLLRFRKGAAGRPYVLQARHNSGDKVKWGWKTLPGSTLADGSKAKIDLFFNNTDNPQSYTFKGLERTLPAASYHVYIDGNQKGADLATELIRNVATPGNNAFRYTGNLNGFSIMSREGANATEFESDGKTRVKDNSASITIDDLKIVHLVGAK